MAEIVEAANSSENLGWLGQIQWPDAIDHFIPEFEMQVASDLKEKGYEVQHHRVNDTDPTKKTNYTIKEKADVSYPEKPEWDWKDAVKQVKGAVSVYFEADQEIEPPNTK